MTDADVIYCRKFLKSGRNLITLDTNARFIINSVISAATVEIAAPLCCRNGISKEFIAKFRRAANPVDNRFHLSFPKGMNK